MKNICVFCGSSRGFDRSYEAGSREFGKVMADEGFNLVYGGANIGLMKVVADEVLAGGKEVYGVMPHFLADKEIAHESITRMHLVGSMAERKQVMADISDAFVILPGGVGTMDEFFEALSWNQLRIMNKPIAILNIKGFFDHLISFLDHALEEKFLRKEHRMNLIVEQEPGPLIEKLKVFKFVEPVEWVERLKIIGY